MLRVRNVIPRGRMRWAAALLLLVAVLAGVSACAEPPTRAISAARTAFGELTDPLQGATWAPEEYLAAEAAMRQADGELRRQAARWGFRRDYRVTLELFRAALEDVERARRAAEAGRELAERDAREAVDAAQVALDHARAALLVAPVGREGRSSAARVSDGLERAALRLQEGRDRLADGEFKEALAAADGVQDDVASLVHSLGR
ncbi:MAG: hypothetical protein ACREAA_08595 [Candidatus Polarisedimenticolia bacterium]